MSNDWNLLNELVAATETAKTEVVAPVKGDYINNGNTVLVIEGKRFVQGAVIDIEVKPDLLAFYLANGHVIKV